MKLEIKTPGQMLTKAYARQTVKREDLERFRINLAALLGRRFNVKFLLAVMNSSIVREFLRANRRSNIHLYPDDWKKLPVPDVPLQEQTEIVVVVDQILNAKQTNPQSDITVLEAEVDRLVSELYGLTGEVTLEEENT